MRQPNHPALRTALFCALTLPFAGCLDQETPTLAGPDYSVLEANAAQPAAWEVYSQNLFLGGDTGPLFSLDLTDPAAIFDVIAATQTFWAQVQQSDIPARAAEFVDVMEERLPKVVALQEAVGYSLGYPTDANDPAGSFVTLQEGPDLLAAVMAEIDARELPYSIAVQMDGTFAVLPLDFDAGIGQPFPWLGVQDRVVILKHDDVQIADTDQGLYQAYIPLGPFAFVRGYARLTVDDGGTPVHFVATHLETQGYDTGDPNDIAWQIRYIHNTQADELLGYLGQLDGEVVAMGDFNSDAAGDPVDPSWTPTYGKFVDAGYTDVWSVAPRPSMETGVTCCQTASRTPDERIDFVFVRGDAASADNGNHRGYFRFDLVGNELADQTDGGLWPSDHAGLNAAIRWP